MDPVHRWGKALPAPAPVPPAAALTFDADAWEVAPDAPQPIYDAPCGRLKIGRTVFDLIVTREPPAPGIKLDVDMRDRTIHVWHPADFHSLAAMAADILADERKGGRQ